ncbi:MAG: SDR family NAD(P)-dependent oxidoreductase [Woeseiaceae bacterium]|nr:SDR family NAD(P)-dependent oxidoreductase [Woeseiaceae bacterium]
MITGGTTGIGYEVVKRLDRENTLFVIAGNRHRLDALQREFPRVLICEADLAEAAAIETAVGMIQSNFERVDLLINNAAVQHTPRFTDPDFDHASIEREITVNFTSVCRLTACLLPYLIAEDRASAIVNVNSGLALAPKTDSAVYCATKAALDVFTRSLRYQLAATNVAVYQAFMPLVDTPMTEGRGSGKMSAATAANHLLNGVARGIEDHYIGKAKMLRLLITLTPWLARRIMRGS